MLWDTFGELVRGSEEVPTYQNWTELPPFNSPDVSLMWNDFRRNADELLASHGYSREGNRYRIVAKNDHRIAVFSHGGTVLLFLAHLLLLPVSLTWCGFYSRPSGLTDFLFEEHSEDWAVPRAIQVADVSHLLANGLTPQPRGMGNWFEDFRY